MIFVRAPRAGTVKTRLAAALGAEGAAEAYRVLVRELVTNIAPIAGVELHYTPKGAAREIVGWQMPGWTIRAQEEGDLGARMHAAFGHAFTEDVTKALLIGSDCPSVSAADIQSGWAALDQSDLVLGPARDGGYWLIGLRRRQPELFQDLPWSTDAVLRETLARAESLGLSWSLLRELSDVDTGADWDDFLRNRGDVRPPDQ